MERLINSILHILHKAKSCYLIVYIEQIELSAK